MGQIPEHFTGGSSLVGNGGSTQVSVKAQSLQFSGKVPRILLGEIGKFSHVITLVRVGEGIGQQFSFQL